MIPLDLLEYEPSVQPMLTRAFSMLIARKDEAAALLASRFRLASVTLGGRVSRPGTLQGGWRGGAVSAARHMMARKLRHDMLQVCSGSNSMGGVVQRFGNQCIYIVQAETLTLKGKLAETSKEVARLSDARAALELSISKAEDSGFALSQRKKASPCSICPDIHHQQMLKA